MSCSSTNGATANGSTGVLAEILKVITMNTEF